MTWDVLCGARGLLGQYWDFPAATHPKPDTLPDVRKHARPIHACRSSDEAVAAGEDLVGPKGANVSLGCVGPGRHGSALASRSDFSTRTGAARKSDTPYGDCFSAMAARSVGVHLSAGASLTWPRGAQGSYYGEEAPPRLHRLSATSREVRRLTRSRKANALLWQPRAGYFVCHPC